MPPVAVTGADLNRVHRATFVFDGYPPAGVPEMTAGCWIYDNAAAARDLPTAAVDIGAAFVAADADDDLHERENRRTVSILRRVDVTRPVILFPPAPVSVALNIAGDITTNGFMPAESTMCVSLRTDTGGPAFRGRMYWPHPCDSTLIYDNQTGLWTTTATARLNTTISEFRTGLLADEYLLITLSRFVVESSGQPPVLRDDPLRNTVTSNFVDVHPDTQRRRGVR